MLKKLALMKSTYFDFKLKVYPRGAKPVACMNIWYDLH